MSDSPPKPSIPPLHVAALLRAYGLRPNKRLGQNFLQDPAILENITRLAEITPEDTVLEIGAGLGSLTRHLARVARQVVAVEIDERFIPVLRLVLNDYTNIRILQGDILEIPPAEIVQTSPYLVVANIPYYITSALLRHLLESHPQPTRVVLTLQKEVAERICAPQGKMSLLALSVQIYGKAETVARIPAGAFYPTPKVDSAVVRLIPYPEPRLPSHLLEDLFRLAKAGFSQKRKTLRNALAAGLGIAPARAADLLHAAGIDPRRRAETLSLREWEALTQQYAAAFKP